MSDLPERIWACRTEHNTLALTTPDFGAEYRRADLSAPVGYSREQMKIAYDEGVRLGIQEDMGSYDGEQANTLSELLATMTPYGSDGVGLSHADVSELITGKPAKDPALLVEALELIAKEHDTPYVQRQIAREALADWKGGRDE